MNLKDIWEIIRQTVKEYSEDNVARLAAALSYYTIFSIAPLLVIVIFIAGLWFSQQSAQEQIVAQIEQLTGSQAAAQAITEMIAGAQVNGTGIVATVIGIATLIFGATGVFVQLEDALNTIWEVKEAPGRGIMAVIKDRFLSFTMILGIGFLLLVSLVVSAALSGLGEALSETLPGGGILWQIVNLAISFGVITLLFAMIFKVLPDVKIAWSDVWLGAAVTALLFTIGKWAIGLYLGTSGVSSAYGAAGSLIVILLWVYYSAQILLIGAEFTQVYARRFGKEIVPEEGAVRLPGATKAQRVASPAASPEAAAPVPVTATPTRIRHLPSGAQIRRRDQVLLPEARPSILAISAVVAALAGFVGGWAVKRVGTRK